MAQTHPLPTIHPAPLRRGAALLHMLAFYPVLVTQGPYVKWRTVRLEEPKGLREGVIGQGPDLRLLIVGDSSAAGVGVPTQTEALSGRLVQHLSPKARLDWQLVARCGNTTPMTLAMVRKAKPRRADVAVVALGVNDITRGTRLGRWLQDKADLLDYLRDDLGVKHAYVSGLPPLSQFPALPNPLRWTLGHQAERFDRALRPMLAARGDCTWITLEMGLNEANMALDGYHPGPLVYRAWAQTVADRIAADFRL